MSTALDKTSKLRREEIPVDLIDPDPLNANEMTEAQFNLLCDNIERLGLVDAVFLVRKPAGRYKMIGGHHRLEAWKMYGNSTIPAVINDDPDFDEDAQKFASVRMNVIHGQLSPAKFFDLYQSMSGKYSEELAQDLFGFADAEEFRKLIAQVSASLPKDLQKDFKKAAKEIKTIDGLAKLLNGMFTKYGDTLPYGFMCFDFGGQESIWLRMDSMTRKALMEIGKRCVEEQRTMDDLLGGLIQLAASGKLESQLVQLIAKTSPILIDKDQLGENMLPTAENLNA